MKKNINEANLKMDLSTYKKVKGQLNPKDIVTITGDKPMSLTSYGKMEEEEVIGPKDPATLKYLSNVIDKDTGEVSKPFTIGDKKYQMVRAMNPNNDVVLGVYCFDDMNEGGENIVHDVSYFEENIANPMKEALGMIGADIQPIPKTEESDNTIGLGEYRHYIVNEKTGKFRKFKSIEELAKATMNEEEKYMGIKEFKKYFETKVFGGKKHVMAEMTPAGNDDELQIKAKRLMDLIQKRIPSNIIDSIKTNKLAQREVIAAFAELIGVPRNGLSSLVQGIKDLAKAGNQQNVNEAKVIKTIKKKDINNL